MEVVVVGRHAGQGHEGFVTYRVMPEHFTSVR